MNRISAEVSAVVVHSYMEQVEVVIKGKTFLSNISVRVEEEDTFLAGKHYHEVTTRRKGLAWYTGKRSPEPFLADEAVFVDRGRDGTASSFTLHKDEEPPADERETGRKHIREVAAQVLIDQGIW